MNETKISAVVVAKNEEKNIERCLKSLKWADEILVVDTGSEDKTVEIAQNCGARVEKLEWMGFGKTKKSAVEIAKYDFIFHLDADEECSEKLIKKILSIKNSLKGNECYRIKRESFYLGRRIKYSGWQKDYQLRLFNRKYGNFSEDIVHESVKFNGDVKYLREPILHYSYPDLRSHLFKMINYSFLSAEKNFIKGKRSGMLKALIAAKLKFVKMYFLKLGFLDGKVGFILALNSAFGVFIKYLRLWEMKRK